MLYQHGRVSYRALKRQFAIPDDYLADLTDAVLFAYPQVREEEGRGLVWTGDTPMAPRGNTVRYKFCMHVLRVFRMPKQRFQEGDSPVLWTFFGSPGANFLVSTW